MTSAGVPCSAALPASLNRQATKIDNSLASTRMSCSRGDFQPSSRNASTSAGVPRRAASLRPAPQTGSIQHTGEIYPVIDLLDRRCIRKEGRMSSSVPRRAFSAASLMPTPPDFQYSTVWLRRAAAEGSSAALAGAVPSSPAASAADSTVAHVHRDALDRGLR